MLEAALEEGGECRSRLNNQPFVCLSWCCVTRPLPDVARPVWWHAYLGTVDRCCVLSMAATTELDLKIENSICGSDPLAPEDVA